MAELLPQRPGSRRTAAGTAAVAILRKKFDVLDKELAAASAAVAAQPNDPGALQHRAELYVARGRKQEALQDLRSAVALDGRASPVDTVSAEWRRVCQWVVWRAYVTLVVVLGAIIVISGLLAVLSDLRGLSPTPLYSAVDRGDLAKVEGLLRAGHSPGSAAVLGVPMGSQLLMQTPLSVAVTQNYPEMVQALLVAGAEPNSGKAEGPLGWISTETPLYSAAQLGHTAVVRKLLVSHNGRRVDVNAGLAAGPFGLLARESPLAVAAARGHLETVVALLEAGGAQPDLGWSVGHAVGAATSPLSYAVDRGHDHVVRALLGSGASPDLGRTVGPGGILYVGTPLYSAARDDRASAVAALLALRALSNEDGSERGETASEVASRLGHSHVLELLAKAA